MHTFSLVYDEDIDTFNHCMPCRTNLHILALDTVITFTLVITVCCEGQIYTFNDDKFAPLSDVDFMGCLQSFKIPNG